MSARLDTATVTRAMLAAGGAGRDRRRKVYARRKCQWTRAEIEKLTREWGEVGERRLMEMLPGRSWEGIARKASRLKLGSPSQGLVSINEAAKRAGVGHGSMRAILTAQGVQVTTMVRAAGKATSSSAGRVSGRWCVVHPDEAMAAVVAYDNARAAQLTCVEAAAHVGIDKVTMHRAVTALTKVRPVDGVRAGAPWAISAEDAREAVALRRTQTRERRAAVIRATMAALATRGAR